MTNLERIKSKIQEIDFHKFVNICSAKNNTK
jgi:hypothetical protein